MKRIVLLTIALMIGVATYAQVVSTSFENWTGNLPDGWMGNKTSIEADSVIQVTTGAYDGSYAVELVNTESSHKRFTTQPVTVTGGQDYEISFWVKGQGDIRTALFDTTWGAYNNYITVNATEWTHYTQIVSAAANSDSAEFIFSVRNTVGPNHLQLDSVTISVANLTIDTVSIHDIQYTTDASGDSPYLGQIIYTGGIVTAAGNGSYFIQSGSGAWNGIYVYDNTNTPAVGDSIIIKCTVDEYYNLTELKSITSFQVVSSGNALPTPVVLATTDVNDEAYEGVLVRVENAECTQAPNNYGEWIVNDGSGDAMVKNMYTTYNATVGQHYNITGPVYFSYGNYKILPRDTDDVEVVTATEELDMVNNIKLYPVPVTSYLNIEADAIISTVEVYSMNGQLAGRYTVNAKNGTLYGLQSGSYIVRINTAKGSVEKKITVK